MKRKGPCLAGIHTQRTELTVKGAQPSQLIHIWVEPDVYRAYRAVPLQSGGLLVESAHCVFQDKIIPLLSAQP